MTDPTKPHFIVNRNGEFTWHNEEPTPQTAPVTAGVDLAVRQAKARVSVLETTIALMTRELSREQAWLEALEDMVKVPTNLS